MQTKSERVSQVKTNRLQRVKFNFIYTVFVRCAIEYSIYLITSIQPFIKSTCTDTKGAHRCGAEKK